MRPTVTNGVVRDGMTSLTGNMQKSSGVTGQGSSASGRVRRFALMLRTTRIIEVKMVTIRHGSLADPVGLRLKVVLALYLLAAALLPFGHHDLACHLKSTTHCTTLHRRLVGRSGRRSGGRSRGSGSSTPGVAVSDPVDAPASATLRPDLRPRSARDRLTSDSSTVACGSRPATGSVQASVPSGREVSL